MKPVPPTSAQPHRGQTLIFMLMMMVILTFVAFSVYDTQHVAVQRVRTQMANDSAALTGARWQLSCLNAIGEINLMKVTTEIVMNGPQPYGDTYSTYADDQGHYQDLFSALDKLQAKIVITGPMLGVLYAEQAAKLNGLHAIPTYSSWFTQIVIPSVQNLMAVYSTRSHSGSWFQYFEDPPGQLSPEGIQLLEDYIELCRQVADTGMAAFPIPPGNVADWLDWTSAGSYARMLASPAFYSAIAGRDWCYLKPLLWIYYDWTFWGPVYQDYTGSPFSMLSLHLVPWTDPYMGLTVTPERTAAMSQWVTPIQNTLANRGLTVNTNWIGGVVPPPDSPTNRYGFNFTNSFPEFDNSVIGQTRANFVRLKWARYGNGWNRPWDTAMVNQYLNGSVVGKYNYAYQNVDSVWTAQSAASVTMAVPNYQYDNTGWTAPAQRDQLSQDLGNLKDLRVADSIAGGGIVASSAARSFGSIDDSTPPTQCPVVLPVFSDVRLIPIIVSSGVNNYDLSFVLHVLFHVPNYTQHGTYVGGCIFCNELRIWDNAAFREIGKEWWARQTNGNPCVVPSGGVGIPSH